MYRHVLGIKGKSVTMSGKIELPSKVSKKYLDNASLLVAIDENIELKGQANLNGGNILLQSNNSLMVLFQVPLDLKSILTSRTHAILLKMKINTDIQIQEILNFSLASLTRPYRLT